MTIEIFLDAILVPILILLWVKAIGSLMPVFLVILGIIGFSTENKNGKS